MRALSPLLVLLAPLALGTKDDYFHGYDVWSNLEMLSDRHRPRAGRPETQQGEERQACAEAGPRGQVCAVGGRPQGIRIGSNPGSDATRRFGSAVFTLNISSSGAPIHH